MGLIGDRHLSSYLSLTLARDDSLLICTAPSWRTHDCAGHQRKRRKRKKLSEYLLYCIDHEHSRTVGHFPTVFCNVSFPKNLSGEIDQYQSLAWPGACMGASPCHFVLYGQLGLAAQPHHL